MNDSIARNQKIANQLREKARSLELTISIRDQFLMVELQNAADWHEQQAIRAAKYRTTASESAKNRE